MKTRAKLYPNLFAAFIRKGSDWLSNIPADDRKAFARIGMQAHNYGRQGGCARASTCRRDKRGRFA